MVLGFLAIATAVKAQEATGGATGAVEPAGFRTYGDFRSVNVEDELASLRHDNEKLVGSVTRKPVTFAAALAKAHELANAAVAPAALAATLKALPDNEAVTLRLFAFAQMAKGSPSAAFAVLVAAYDRDPKSPDALADIAGMLAGFGYANEALAFLDELEARKVLPSPPMGISGREAVDYVRGYTLARLGDSAGAMRLLRPVADRQPALAEAARMMAILSEDEAEQRKYMLLGVWRHRSPLMVCAGVDITQPEPDPMSTGEEVAIDARALINPAKGKHGKQPSMHYAQTVLQANDMVPKMEIAKSAASDKQTAIDQQRVRPKGYTHTDTSVDETWGYRMHELINSIDYRDAKLRELERRRRELMLEREAAYRKITDQRDDDAAKAQDAYVRECLARKYSPTMEQLAEKARPAFQAALTQFTPYIVREDQAVRAWFDEWHFLATAIAAQVGDSGWHDYIRYGIEMKRWHTYARLLHLVEMHATAGQNPLITKEEGEVPTEPEEEEVEKCDGDKSIGFSTGHLPGGKALPFEVGVEMTCEGMSLEASIDTRIPGLSVSAEIGGDNEGNFTAFVGPKAEAFIGDKNITAFSGSAKAGAYVTGNSKGVTDAGVKYEVKVGGKIGAFSAQQKIAEGNVSFMPAPDYSSGDFGPLSP